MPNTNIKLKKAFAPFTKDSKIHFSQKVIGTISLFHGNPLSFLDVSLRDEKEAKHHKSHQEVTSPAADVFTFIFQIQFRLIQQKKKKMHFFYISYFKHNPF